MCHRYESKYFTAVDSSAHCEGGLLGSHVHMGKLSSIISGHAAGERTEQEEVSPVCGAALAIPTTRDI